jgi:hypothetical protein
MGAVKMAETDDADAPEPRKRRFAFDFERKAAESTPARAAAPKQESARAPEPDEFDEDESADFEPPVAEPARPVAALDRPSMARTPLPAADDRPRPLTDETLASMVAGRTLETEEEERTFLLTLSRDQRLKYAELLNASERLDLDRESHNLEFDRLQLQREQMAAEEIGRFRANAFAFAVSGIRTLLAMNGAGAIMLLAVWGYLAALPVPPISAEAFVLALAAFGFGTVASTFTALAAYSAQAVRAGLGRERLRRSVGEVLRITALVLVFLAFVSFFAGILLTGYGLRAG